MWFVVKVLKIENGGEGYEVRGWGGREGRKSGLRVGGMTFFIGWGGWGYEIHPQGGRGRIFGVLSYSCGNISARYQPQYKFDDYRSEKNRKHHTIFLLVNM